MIQIKNRTYFINESEIVSVFKWNKRYWVKDNGGNRLEISENDYLNLGGRIDE